MEVLIAGTAVITAPSGVTVVIVFLCGSQMCKEETRLSESKGYSSTPPPLCPCPRQNSAGGIPTSPEAATHLEVQLRIQTRLSAQWAVLPEARGRACRVVGPISL